MLGLARHPMAAAGALLLLSLGLLLPGADILPVLDRDEPRFSQATWEMMERGEWAVPYFNDAYRFDKPPLTYWWMRLHYEILGKTELAARLHSVFATWLTAVAVAALGRFLFGARAGLLAALAWLTCMQVLVHGRGAVADMPLLLGITVSMYAISRLLFAETAPPRFGRWFWLLAAGLAFGFLAKGPLALFVPLLALVLHRFLFRQRVPWRRLQPITVTLVAMAVVAAWGIPALIRTQGEFWDQGMGEHVVRRGTDVFNNRVWLPVVFYLGSAFLSLLPWSAFAPAAWRKDDGRRDGKTAFLLSWFMAPFLIFAFYATQLPHYIMPGFPAFFLLLCRHGEFPRLSTPSSRLWYRIVFGLFAGGALIGLGAAAWAPFADLVGGLRPLLALGSLLLLLLTLSALFLRRQMVRTYVAWALVGNIVGMTAFACSLREVHAVTAMREHWEGVPEQTRFAASRFLEPSLVFYSTGFWRMGDLEDTLEWLGRDGEPRVAVILLREWKPETFFQATPMTDYDRSERALASVPDRYERHIVTGFNPARGTWVETLVCVPAGLRAAR